MAVCEQPVDKITGKKEKLRMFSLKSTMSWGAHFLYSFHIVLKVLAKIKR